MTTPTGTGPASPETPRDGRRVSRAPLAVALAATLGGLALKGLFLAIDINTVYLPLLLAVSAAAWRGGAPAGLLVTALTAAADLWLFEPPVMRELAWPAVASLGAYVMAGVLVSGFAEVRLRALRAAETSREEALRLQEQQRAVLQSIDEPVLVVSADEEVILSNRAADALVGPIARLEQLRPRLRPVGSGRMDLAPGDVVEARLEGTDRVLRLAVARVRDRPGGVRVLAIRDVTELRRAEEAREVFIGILSHELRTPVTTILAGVALLGRDLPEEDRRVVMADIVDEAERLRRLVEDVLVLSRFERAAIEIRDEPVVIHHLVSAIAAQEARRATPPAEVRVEIGADLPPARADAAYLEQILRNVIGNAVKYGGADGPVIVHGERRGDTVEIVVTDVGPGFPESDAERLFELFYRSRQTSSKPGAGIGLFVARQLARSMGGDLTARPRPGGGAEFRLSLRVIEAPEEAPAGEAAP